MKSYQYLINKTFLKIWIVIFQMVSWHLSQVFSYLTGVESPSVVDTILKFSKSQNFTVLQNLRAHTSDQFSKFFPQNHMHNMHMDVFSLPTYTCSWMWKMSNKVNLQYFYLLTTCLICKCFGTTYLSELPDASKSSFGWYSTMLTGPLWYVKSVRILPAVISQIYFNRICMYIEFPLYMYLNYKTCINSTRLSNCTQNCLQWNQTLTRPSSPADAIHFPSGLNLTQLTPFLWPCGWRVNLDSSLRHQLTCNTHTMYHKYHVVKQKFILTLYV